MINDEYKIIYTRVPKTASSAIINSLANREVRLQKCIQHKKELYEKSSGKFCDTNHVPLYIIKDCISSDSYENYYKFAFVRNPYQRFVSAYHYNVSWMEKNEPVKMKELPLESFKQWMTNYTLWPKMWRTKQFQCQYDYVAGSDFVGRYENLQNDFNIICRKIGIPEYILPHINKSEHDHYTEYYDDETRHIVSEIFAKDIEYFGYKFGE